MQEQGRWVCLQFCCYSRRIKNRSVCAVRINTAVELPRTTRERKKTLVSPTTKKKNKNSTKRITLFYRFSWVERRLFRTGRGKTNNSQRFHNTKTIRFSRPQNPSPKIPQRGHATHTHTHHCLTRLNWTSRTQRNCTHLLVVSLTKVPTVVLTLITILILNVGLTNKQCTLERWPFLSLRSSPPPEQSQAALSSSSSSSAVRHNYEHMLFPEWFATGLCADRYDRTL